MKLAAALAERKAIKTKMEDLKKRIYQNSTVQDGDDVIEDPLGLIKELQHVTDQFRQLVTRINQTNNATQLPDGISLMEAIIKKDMLNYLHLIHTNLADKATPKYDRYSQREIKLIPTVNISDIRKKADTLAKQLRQLNLQIQELNWHTELI